MSVSVNLSAQARPLPRVPYHPVAFGNRHLWRSWSPRAFALADLRIRRIPSTRPTQPVSVCSTTVQGTVESSALEGDPPQVPQMADEIPYIDDSPRTESRPTIEPIIVPQFIDFHPLLVIWRRHHQGHGRPNPSHCPRRAAQSTRHAVLFAFVMQRKRRDWIRSH